MPATSAGMTAEVFDTAQGAVISAPFEGPRIEIAWRLYKGTTMIFARRRCLQLALAIAAASSFSHAASALDYPTRPVRLIVPVAAGGGADITARLIGQWLS